MRRCEVWWAEQPEPIGKRPVVLLSRDEAYKVRNAITIAQVTTTMRGIPVEVFLDKKDGLPRKCVANLDTVTTIRKAILVERICSLRSDKVEQIDEALKFALGLE
ncbi:type II toxin-antitoxin system PemK/MazF family toxin [Patescibacteria group bacterium]|nr:type II toxin-antitoxin system PemK/MazF family toxin [Candidatus Omnitrophota bacterium]MBU1128903.1 type II toxin-antitoxin system PemK/MazF family toxin [Candidatus Omnitrophota bacterium]MBU1685666.1 type II toxin-antitoxin system PemK/MazF family toxin [Patescibacteria group bacterium]MBU1784205.1 type II toxin-antitoxin system PemK/MazF family toxin [Candidatus Omnitrophota bacterium]MBU1852028.1 type II toxin-antitoxin system PemK/MazF family toxin [Candidatus Omnitrophota bacterium]